MKRVLVIFVFVAGVFVGHAIPLVTAQTRTAKTTNLGTTDLGNWCDGKEVTVEVNEFSPGTSGKHYHPAHSYTSILEGVKSYTLEGQPTRTVSTGDVLHEAPRQVHTLENDRPVKLLVLPIAENGKPATIRVP